MNRNTVISKAIAHAETIERAIGLGLCPAKDDCRAVLEDISALCRLRVSENGKREKGLDMEALCLDFTYRAQLLLAQLEAMRDLITGGRVPSEESIEELCTSMYLLRGTYDAVCGKAREQLPAEEMPGEDAPVEAYAAAVRNSQALQRKKRLEAAADCLRKFLSVCSESDKYAGVLAPYQREAEDLLHRLSGSDGADPEQLEQDILAPRTLIAAIECEDKDSEEELELCEKLDAFYPKRISFGVAKDQYYIDYSIYELLAGEAR